MGMFDTFYDKEKEIQLKNFECVLHSYSVGEIVPMKEYGFPDSASFFCWADPKEGFVIIKENVFVGIEEKPLANEKIFNCNGEEMVKE